SASFYRREINPLLGREASRNRRSLYARFIIFSRRGLGFRRLGLCAFLRRRGLRFLLFGGRRFLRLGLLFLFRRSFLFFRFRLRLFFLFCLRRGFSLSADEGNLLADFYLPAFLDVNFREGSVLGRFPFHRRLVCFDLCDHVPRLHLVTL